MGIEPETFKTAVTQIAKGVCLANSALDWFDLPFLLSVSMVFHRGSTQMHTYVPLLTIIFFCLDENFEGDQQLFKEPKSLLEPPQQKKVQQPPGTIYIGLNLQIN